MITKLKYSNEDMDFVTITFDDGSFGHINITDGITRQYTKEVHEYLDAGGTIEPYKTASEIAEAERLAERKAAQEYLDSTDFKFVGDYDEVVSDEIKQKRRAARQILRQAI